MEADTRNWRRGVLGFGALGCLAGALVLWMLDPGTEDSQRWMFIGGLARVGTVLAALWIALPSRNRPAAWSNISARGVIAAAIAVFAVTRIPLRIVLPAVAVLAFLGVALRPRQKERPRTRVGR